MACADLAFSGGLPAPRPRPTPPSSRPRLDGVPTQNVCLRGAPRSSPCAAPSRRTPALTVTVPPPPPPPPPSPPPPPPPRSRRNSARGAHAFCWFLFAADVTWSQHGAPCVTNSLLETHALVMRRQHAMAHTPPEDVAPLAPLSAPLTPTAAHARPDQASAATAAHHPPRGPPPQRLRCPASRAAVSCVSASRA